MRGRGIRARHKRYIGMFILGPRSLSWSRPSPENGAGRHGRQQPEIWRWSRLAELVVSCCQSVHPVRPFVRLSVRRGSPDTNPTAFRGRRWIHAFLLSEGAPPRGLKAETHPNCVRETGQSATRVCVRASAWSKECKRVGGDTGAAAEGQRDGYVRARRSVPVPTSCPSGYCPLAVDTVYYKVWRTE